MISSATPLLLTQTDPLTILKLGIRYAMNNGKLEQARDLLRQAENQMGSDTRDPELEKLSEDLHERATALNGDDTSVSFTNDGHVIHEEATLDAGGTAERSTSFASEIELDSYKPGSIGDSSKLSRNAFPDAGGNSTLSASQTQDPLHVRGVNHGFTQGAGASKASQAADDAFAPLAASLDIGLGGSPGLG